MPLVYLVDERISKPRAALANVPDVDLGFLITSYMSVAEIVSTVIKRLAAPPEGARNALQREQPAAPMITALRILAHGDGGELALGRGIDPRNAGQLAPLTSHIRAGASARCLLLGCSVASGAPKTERYLGGAALGQRVGLPGCASPVSDLEGDGVFTFPLLRALARTLGMPVTAGFDAPSPARDWQFLGATVTVEPFGRVTFTGVDAPFTI